MNFCMQKLTATPCMVSIDVQLNSLMVGILSCLKSFAENTEKNAESTEKFTEGKCENIKGPPSGRGLNRYENKLGPQPQWNRDRLRSAKKFLTLSLHIAVKRK